MSRPFVSEFLLPLVQGGIVEVGRPVAPRDVSAWMEAQGQGRLPPAERDAITSLNEARIRALQPLVSLSRPLRLQLQSPFRLEEDTWRLGAAVHNLLALSHPRIVAGPGSQSRVERVAAAAAALGNLGAPLSLDQALARHSLLARLPEIARFDHTVRYWLGHRTFVGRRPPARMLALPGLRQVSVQSVRRTWLRDVGVQAAARPAFAALTEASPLGEALDPLRLDPPWSWGRVLSILRFPALCRLVAGRLINLGWARTADALTAALYRYVSLQDIAGPVPASPEAVSFAIGFLAHLTWLDHLFAGARTSAEGAASGPVNAPGSSGMGMSVEAGREVTVLLSAALAVAPHLVWPTDVPPHSDLGQGFARQLERLAARHDVSSSLRRGAATQLVRVATGGAWPRAASDAV